jgi:hypothetical protein
MLLESNKREDSKQSEAHYLTFQDYLLPKDNDQITLSETWQQTLCEIFDYVNFEEYYKMSVYSHKQPQGSLFTAILNDIRTVPEMFWVVEDKREEIKFLVEMLISDNKEVLYEELVSLINLYKQEVSKVTSREEIIMKLMQGVITTTETY